MTGPRLAAAFVYAALLWALAALLGALILTALLGGVA